MILFVSARLTIGGTTGAGSTILSDVVYIAWNLDRRQEKVLGSRVTTSAEQCEKRVGVSSGSDIEREEAA